jgi:folate-dependent phosphoribosylglycinamide formyltransferase PurN
MLGRLIGIARSARPWRPTHARLVLRQLLEPGHDKSSPWTDGDHLVAAAQWLRRAQAAQGDGGFSGRYTLRSGWTPSYPETTGYIVPTLLRLHARWPSAGYHDSAARAVGFLKSVQLPSGAFPGGEVASGSSPEPSVFNSAQIIHGLTEWRRHTGDESAILAARRAADWMLSVQDPDGSWSRHVYKGLASAYSAFASCWLAELGEACGIDAYRVAAGRHLGWILGLVDPSTGWVDRSGFSAEDHARRQAVTHTIAYTLQGMLTSSRVLRNADGIAAVRRAATEIARVLELRGRLPGVLGHDWRGRASYSCVTGTAQMAILWIELARTCGDLRLLNTALKAIDAVKRAQPMVTGNPGLRGAIPGSHPVWGKYQALEMVNWGAKFFCDALLAKEDALRDASTGSGARWEPPPEVPRAIEGRSGGGERPPSASVVMLGTATSRRTPFLLETWKRWGFRPTAVVALRPKGRGVLARARRRLAQRGLVGSVLGRRPKADARSSGQSYAEDGMALPDTVRYAQDQGLPLRVVADAEEIPAALRELSPDLVVHDGSFLLRKPALSIPRLGTLNTHMGLLPKYRGMNVVEWAALHGDAIGCTTHLIDEGIDTGPILCCGVLASAEGRGPREIVRRRADSRGVELLGEAVRFVQENGVLPRTVTQRPGDGMQFFRMHPDLLRVAASRLAGTPPTAS